MTTINVDPTHLHGVAQTIAASSAPIQSCATAVSGSTGPLTAGIGSDNAAFVALSNAVHNFCDAYGSWFNVCGNGVAALSSKASSAADTYRHVDTHVFVPGPHNKPLPLPA